MTRREFIGGAIAASTLGPASAFAEKPSGIRAVMLGLGRNMWGTWVAPGEAIDPTWRVIQDCVRFDESVWRRSVDRAREKGLNMVLMDIGDFVEYPRRPDLAIKGSWKPERMNAEVKRLKAMGLEPIPKVNFSTAHDSWLKVYHRMVSSRPYYECCADVLKDVYEIFDKPRFIHIGMDEEAWESKQVHCVVRRGDLWYHDLEWFARGIEKLGAQAWIWSDKGWHDPDFVKRCPKSVLQSNWYYNERLHGFSTTRPDGGVNVHLKLFCDLDAAGFEQVPCSSNYMSEDFRKAGLKDNAKCMGEVVKFCRANVSPGRLKGFLMASWENCENDRGLKTTLDGIDQLAAAMD